MEAPMPRGDKSGYTPKQKRMAAHIEDGYEARGVSEKEAERRAWATVNKETGGARKTASGSRSNTGKSSSAKPSRTTAARTTGTKRKPERRSAH
jgi:hypothetical protein